MVTYFRLMTEKIEFDEQRRKLNVVAARIDQLLSSAEGPPQSSPCNKPLHAPSTPCNKPPHHPPSTSCNKPPPHRSTECPQSTPCNRQQHPPLRPKPSEERTLCKRSVPPPRPCTAPCPSFVPSPPSSSLYKRPDQPRSEINPPCRRLAAPCRSAGAVKPQPRSTTNTPCPRTPAAAVDCERSSVHSACGKKQVN